MPRPTAKIKDKVARFFMGSLYPVTSSFSQVQADELVLASCVKQTICNGGKRSNRSGQDLGSAFRLKALRCYPCRDEFALFSQNKQLVARAGEGSRSSGIIFPTHGSFLQINTP